MRRRLPLPRVLPLLPLLPLLAPGCGDDAIHDAVCGDVAVAGAPLADPGGAGKACDHLGAYRVFAGDGPSRLRPEFVAYDLNTPLFSDYALKSRAIYVPAGSAAAYVADDVFDFPVGTVIVKTFSFPADLRQPERDVRAIETRLLVHHADGWKALPYVWNDTATTARYAPLGSSVAVTFVDANGTQRNVAYHVPDLAECKECHSRVNPETGSKDTEPIGPKAKHINREYDYGDGAANQLTALGTAGFLSGVPANPAAAAPALAVWNDPASGPIGARARAYLDANCAHCHNDRGTAAGSGLILTSDEPEGINLGICKPPIRGIGGAITHSIVPGDPDASAIVFRMGTNDPKNRMPRLGRSLVHDEGVALIREWIASLDPDDYGCGATSPTP